MRRSFFQALALMIGVSSIASPIAVRADVFRTVGLGLQSAGFDVRGQSNPASGGYEFLVNNQFQNRQFDFGAWDLTLNGPISTQFSTGGRVLSNLDVALTTALNSDAGAQPLTYELNYDAGAQATKITGSLLVDANLNLNAFGFYDLGLNYSTRQTVVNSGTVSNSTTDFDSDLGPINVRGNIFADALAAITDPLFAAARQPNPFEMFSGANQLKLAIQAQGDALLASLGAGLADAPSASALRGTTSGFVGPQVPRAGGLTASNSSPGSQNVGVVPEPPVLLLMLLGIPALLGLRRRAA